MKFEDISRSVSNWFVAFAVSSNSDLSENPEGDSVELIALEERVLYSASPVPMEASDGIEPAQADIDEAMLAESVDQNLDMLQFQMDEANALDQADFDLLDSMEPLADVSTLQTARELVVIDTSVEDFQQLVDDILARADQSNFQIEYLDSSTQGVAYLSSLITGSEPYDAIHLVTHGSDGQLQIGMDTIDSSNLGEFADEFQSWSSSLTGDADFLIYGCDVAESESGESFVEELADLTGADVAASDDLTGHASLGGDWFFEFTTGVIEADFVFSLDAVADWNHTLATVDATSEGGSTASRHTAADANGNIISVFSSTDLGIDGEDIIVDSRTFEDAVTPLFDRFVANETTDGIQKWATVASAENGDFVVVWTSDNGADSGIYARLFNAAGSPKGGEFLVAEHLGAELPEASVAMDRHGNFVVTWEEGLTATEEDILAQRFSATGDPIGGRINIAVGAGDEVNPDVAINDVGDFVVGWQVTGVGVFFEQFDFETGVGSGAVQAGGGLFAVSDISVDINDAGWIAQSHTVAITIPMFPTLANLDINSSVYNPAGDEFNLPSHLIDLGDQFNSSVAITNDNNFYVAFEGDDDGVDDQGAYYSHYSFDDNGTPGNTNDDFFLQETVQEQLLNNPADVGLPQENVAVTKVRGEEVVFGFVENNAVLGVDSFAETINQTPDVIDSNVTRLENRDFTFSLDDFEFLDNESDTFSQIAIHTLPQGRLLYQGVEITAADVAPVDGFVIPAGNIGDLTYEFPAGQTDTFGPNLDSFEYRVHDGNNFSVDNAVLTINVEAEQRLWISTEGDGAANGSLPAFNDGDVLQLGGAELTLGDDTVAEWSTPFSLESRGLDVDAIHHVQTDVVIGNGSGAFSLNAGDILFSVDGSGPLTDVMVDAGGGLVQPFPAMGLNVDSNDIVVFRPGTPGDFSTGTFEVVVDTSMITQPDSQVLFQNLEAFTLIEQDTVVDGVLLQAGSFLAVSDIGNLNNDIFLLEVDSTGSGSTSATASLFLEGAQINQFQQISSLDFVERTITVGGQTLQTGTILGSLGTGGLIGTNSLMTSSQDVFALELESTSLNGETAVGTASILVDGSDIDLNGGNASLDALSILGDADPFTPQSMDFSLEIAEDSAYTFAPSDFTIDSGGNSQPLDSITIETLPVNGELLLDGTAVFAGQRIESSDLENLRFIPGANESGEDYAAFDFRVNESGTTSAVSTVLIDVFTVAGDVTILGGNELFLLDSHSVNDTTLGAQDNQQVTALANGGYVIAWESTDGLLSNGDDGTQVFYKVYDAQGQEVGFEQRVGQNGEQQNSPSVTGLADGGFVIVWTDDTSASTDVYGQRFDADGNSVGVDGQAPFSTPFLINNATQGSQFGPVVVALADGGFAVSYSSGATEIAVDGIDIVSRIYESDGSSGNEFLVNTVQTTGTQRNVSAVALDNGGYALTWSSLDPSGTFDTHVAILDENGNGEEVKLDTASADTRNPVIARVGTDEIVVVWQGFDSDSWGIFAQRFTADGIQTGPEILINTIEDGGQVRPDVTSLNDGGVLITWDTPGGAVDSRSIAGQRFDSSFNRVGDIANLTSRLFGLQGDSSITQLADGTLISTYTSADGDNDKGTFASGVIADRFISSVSGGLDGEPISLGLDIELLDLDSSESITDVRITGAPAGTIFSDGTNTGVSDGMEVNIDGWDYSAITVTPSADSIDDFVVSVDVLTVDNDGVFGAFDISSTQIHISPGFSNQAGVYADTSTSTPEDTIVTIDAETLYPAAGDPDSMQVGAPSIEPDLGFTLTDSTELTPSGTELILTGENRFGSPVNAIFDSTAVSLDTDPGSSYGAIDAALVFDGTGGGFFQPKPNGAGNTTFEILFRPDDLTQNSTLLEFGSDNRGAGLYLVNDTVEFRLHNPMTLDGNQTEPYVLLGTGITAADFNHVVVVIDSDGSSFGDSDRPGIQLYVNGERTDLIADIGQLFPGFQWSDNNAASIGTPAGTFDPANGAAPDSFSGAVAELNIYNDRPVDDEGVYQLFFDAIHTPTITSIDGQAVTVGDPITLTATGALVTLNADGSISYDPNGQFDHLAGTETVVDTFAFEVSDGLGGISGAQVSVNINATESAPVLDDVIADPITEGIPFGTEVIQVQATDADTPVEQLTYDIVGGNETGAFTIDPSTGSITVANPAVIDFESQQQYILTISASDPEGGSDTGLVTINLENADEARISGTIFDDVNADADISGDDGASFAFIHLYRDVGTGIDDATYVTNTTTDSDGNYFFDGLDPGEYFVVVDATSIEAATGIYDGAGFDAFAQQTYATAGALARFDTGDVFTLQDGAFYGGAEIEESDDASHISTGQHVNRIVVDGSGTDVSGIDFGFSFNVVTNILDSGDGSPIQGSFRQFIHNSNSVVGDNRMVFIPLTATNASGATGDWWRIEIAESLPLISDSGTVIDGQAFTQDYVERDPNQFVFGASGTVGTGADGISGTGDELGLLTATGMGGLTEAGLDAPELELVNTGDNLFGLRIRATNDQPVVENVGIHNIAIHGFGDSGSGLGGNIFVDGRGTASDGTTDFVVRDVEISGNLIGVSPDGLVDPESLDGRNSVNITVSDVPSGYIFDNIIGFASNSGIEFRGNGSADATQNWVVAGNLITSNATESTNSDGINAIFGIDGLTVFGNEISNHSGTGVDSFRSGDNFVIAQNTISDNGFGMEETAGIRIFGSDFEVAGNVISNSAGAGVQVQGANADFIGTFDASSGNTISMNEFSGNGENAIDLNQSFNDGNTFSELDSNGDSVLSGGEIPTAILLDLAEFDLDNSNTLDETEFKSAIDQVVNLGDGITLNDGVLNALSGNDGLDSLTLTGVRLGTGGLVLEGAWNNALPSLERIEVYVANPLDGDFASGTGFGEGAFLISLDASQFTIDAAGNFTALIPEPVDGWQISVVPGTQISTLAFDSNGNTSEFGNNETVLFVPVAGASAEMTNEDEVLTFDVNDFKFSDADHPVQTNLIVDSLPGAGTLFLNGVPVVAGQSIPFSEINNSALTYQPGPEYFGIDTFGFAVNDGTLTSDNVELMSITVNPVNDAPTAVDSSVELNEDGNYDIEAGDIILADPADGDVLESITITLLPTSGTLTLNGSAVDVGDLIPASELLNLTYTPNGQFHGTDELHYSVTDDGGTASGGEDTSTNDGVLTFNVLSVNDAPTAIASFTQLPEDGSATVGVTFFDPNDNDVLQSITIRQLPTSGLLTLNGNPVAVDDVILAADLPGLLYTPDAEYHGSDSVGYLITDDGGTANGGVHTSALTQTVFDVQSVNDAPTAVDSSVELNEDGSYDIESGDIVLDDPADGDVLESITITLLPTSGTLTLNGSAVDVGDLIPASELLNLTYTPDGQFHGTDELHYSVTDDGGTANGGTDTSDTDGVLTFNVQSVNDAPTAIASFTQLPEDGSATVGVTFFDPNDNDGLQSITIRQLPTSGLLTLNGNPVFVDDVIQAADLPGLLYTPNPDFNGTDSVGYLITDDGGTANGGVDTSALTQTVFDVQSVNDAPTAVDSSVELNEDGSYDIQPGDIVLQDPADGDGLRSITITTLPTSGTLTLNGSAVNAGDSIPASELLNLTYTPDGQFHGTDELHYSVTDDGGTANGGTDTSDTDGVLTFNVQSVNDAPTAVDSTVELNEDGSYDIQAGDIVLQDPADGDSFDSVTITSLPTSGTLTLNGAIVSQGDSIPSSELLNLTYTPNGDFHGTDELQYLVTDDGGTANGGQDTSTAVGVLTFDVQSINDAPTTSGTITVAIAEDTSHVFRTGDVIFADPVDGDALSAIRITELPDSGSLTLNGADVSVGQSISESDLPNLLYTPDLNFNGTDSVEYAVIDDGGTANGGVDESTTEATIEFDVQPANDNPELTSPTFIESPENRKFVGELTGIDPDGDAVSFEIAGGPDGGLFQIIPGTSNLEFIDPPDFFPRADDNQDGIYEVDIEITDGLGGSTIETISIEVTDVMNEPPVFPVQNVFDIDEESQQPLVITEAVIEGNGPIEYALLDDLDSALFQFDPDTRELRFINPPDADVPGAPGVYQVTIEASSGPLRVTTQTVTINVNPINDNAPEFSGTNFDFQIFENSDRMFDLSATDIDLPGQTVTYSLSGDDAEFFSIDVDGNLSFINPPDAENPLDLDGDNLYHVEVTADDNVSLSTTTPVTVEVLEVDEEAPVIGTGFLQFTEGQNVPQAVLVTDVDSPATSLEFEIVGGIDQGAFQIDPDTGELSFLVTPDFENPLDDGNNNIYTVDVRVTDPAGHTDVRAVEIEVIDVNEGAPQIEPGNFQVSENSVPMLQVDATDDSANSVLTYAISGGADAGLFVIDPDSGELTFVSGQDFENPLDSNSNNVYEVEVTVSDNHATDPLESTRLIRVSVTPENDNDPVFVSQELIRTLENQTDVGTVVATDADSPLQTVEYQISGGDDASLFSIDSNTGELQFIAPADFELPQDVDGNNIYEVEVTAADGEGGFTIQSILVGVLDQNDLPTATDDFFTIREGGQLVVTESVIGNDVDRFGEGLSISLISGPSSGELVWQNDGTFRFVHDGNESGEPAEIQYSITDAAGQSSIGTVVIDVTPVDDPTVLGDDGLFIVDPGEALTIESARILENDGDTDSEIREVRIVEQGEGGVASIDANGNLVFDPDPGFSGSTSIQYAAVTADGVQSESATINFFVEPIVVVADNTPEDTNESNDQPEQTTDDPLETEDAVTTNVSANNPNNEPVVTTTLIEAAGFVMTDNGADTLESGVREFDADSSILNLDLSDIQQGYIYQTVENLIDSPGQGISGRALGNAAVALSTFDPTTLVAYWGQLDSAKHEFLAKFEIDSVSMAASFTSFLTVGYLAWIVRGGVLLTTFMSSIPAWQSFDPLPVIEQAARDEDEDDESIEQLVN